MKTKYLILPLICLVAVLAYAQSDEPKQTQFLLIIRSKSTPPAKELVADNIKHWQTFMGGLARGGILVGGFRPELEGETMSGAAKTEKKGSYTANGEVVSSMLVINATDMAKAKSIAAKCPVFELQGSVEIRPLQDMVK